MAKRAGTIYVADITYGSIPMRRGHWSDRLPNIDHDLDAMRAVVAKAPAGTAEKASSGRQPCYSNGEWKTIASVSRLQPHGAHDVHSQPATTAPASGEWWRTHPPSVDLYYRHVNQGERWRSTSMDKKARGYEATIPLEYYFVIHQGNDSATSSPSFEASLSNQPYYAVWRRT